VFLFLFRMLSVFTTDTAECTEAKISQAMIVSCSSPRHNDAGGGKEQKQTGLHSDKKR
jgi:hypothetical protein